MTTLLYVGSILTMIMFFCWMVFFLYTAIRDDRRNERERKERLARDAELAKKLNH